ncbi:NFACT RNA binding domain-containing protein [Roseofilum reptotaenium CS-1145]|uniref:Rqc2 homolog RqcH n=1 Tax=Roseofilum reptotaenium AO1-A TaxID=1925591 RepID=A0A1L9QUW9_9CYAN|nr:NFACT RNA binding domain-containing protein [Roseofilum reptotaenium]MDB9516371.1 NFACT RNA binding domain-containing protein [Roseofilum reptotaenium CS-1145]OJJ26426.1 hypothetical protein BI308_06110 [Roseofilum reptotaenium AO1-A]
MQPVDFTTLMAICADLRDRSLPARLEQVFQRDRFRLSLALRMLQGRGWLTLCWHPQAAHIAMSSPPPKAPDTFTFSDQLRHQLNGLALVSIAEIAPWERAIDLQFAQRPGDPIRWHLIVEVMGKYSNVILVNQENIIVTAAHQVSEQQSSVRPILTGQPYVNPPALKNRIPSLEESFSDFRGRVGLIPGPLKRQLLQSYRGLSPRLIESWLFGTAIALHQPTDSLSDADWSLLYDRWQHWLHSLQQGTFTPGWTKKGYTVMPWDRVEVVESVQNLISGYYNEHLDRQEFSQLHYQLQQKVRSHLGKLHQKALLFRERLNQSQDADRYRYLADLLMAHLHQWQPGMQAIELADFETGKPVKIPLNLEKNGVQNAQALYKKHQKLKRSQLAVQPLLEAVETEQRYLEQVETTLLQLAEYGTAEDLSTLEEVREELIEQKYLDSPASDYQRNSHRSQPHRYQTPSGFEVLVGRNNRQNDRLTFRLAGAYDLWFHTQEIPGSHVLMRVSPGQVPDTEDLQFVANLAAHYSQGRQSKQIPVVYTEPKSVYKPKGAQPGMVVYKHERILWGCPQEAALES